MKNATRAVAAAAVAVILSLLVAPGIAQADELPPCSTTQSPDCTTGGTNTEPGPFLPGPAVDCSGAIDAMQDLLRLSSESDAAWTAELEASEAKVDRLQSKVAELRKKLRQVRHH